MTQDLFPHAWLTNNLFDEGFIEKKAKELSSKPLPHDFDNWMAGHFRPVQLAAGNEAQLETGFIRPLLTQLGWESVPQQSFIVQGKLAKPDWCLMTQAGHGAQLVTTQNHELISAICESKAWGLPLDTGKANKENPHHQLQDYLSTLRVRFGFLTNGRRWRLYDTDKITAKKTFIEFDLERIWALDDPTEKAGALALFVFFFSCNAYTPPAKSQAPSAIEQAIAESSDFALEVEENLKAVIYGFDGEDSLFEIMGKAIYSANAKQKIGLDAVYENSVILLFRLLFVVYFEDKNHELLDKHPFYKKYSLRTLYQTLSQSAPERAGLFDGVYALKQLFEMLDQGAQDIDIPLFNGGLFDSERAPLLLTPKIFDNATLRTILEKLMFKTHRGNTLFETRRDFKNMSLTHLGRIYEGLLEFRFERAQETATYLEYVSGSTKGKSVEAYFDAYDAANVRKEKGFKSLRELSVKKGEVYLKSANNSRKTSASYYTPTSLSERLVKAGIDHAIDSGRELVNLKILDNACGSGHFLVGALNYLTDLALAKLETDAVLQKLVQEESEKITEQLRFLNLDYQPDDAQILKRALLKRCIYGVDLNPFAVELARLSLWMDSFIFGTPLSFIEHHVQHGNALMGATVQGFIDYNASDSQQNDLFVDDLRGRFDELRTVMQELDAMRDTTAEEVEQSKRLWQTSIQPKLQLLGRALSFISTRAVLRAEGDTAAVEALDKTPNLLAQLFDEEKNKTAVLQKVQTYAKRYSFFHYEVAFPEAFAREQKGFDVVLGNPPWDKTKFSDADFFPQYHSNYRSLKNQDKEAVRQRLMQSSHIAQAYDRAQRSMEVANNYYKAAYPLNKGAGDGNLFRFFVERNLSLLAPMGSLSYVLPSAIMFEDGSQALRQHILQRFELRFFHSFENNMGIFADVHRSYKFALMQVCKPPSDVSVESLAVIDTAFYLLDPSDLYMPNRRVSYPVATLKTLSPNQWALMELRDGTDLPILSKCYAAFNALSEDWLDFRNELHMTSDKDLFMEKQVKGALPLYEGKMIWQYSHKLDDPQYWLDAAAMDERQRSKEIHRMAQDIGIKKDKALEQAAHVRFDREYVRLAFREIARDTDERSLIFAMLPSLCGYGHTLFANTAKRYVFDEQKTVITKAVSQLRLLFALAWFNSLPTDWLARFMVQIHVSKTYLYRLPMPQPDDAEILQNANYKKLARNALLLTLASSWDDFAVDLEPAMQLLGVQRKDLPQTAKAQDLLRAENDKVVAKLYGIDASEFAHILKSFPGMANKRPEYVALLQDD